MANPPQEKPNANFIKPQPGKSAPSLDAGLHFHETPSSAIYKFLPKEDVEKAVKNNNVSDEVIASYLALEDSDIGAVTPLKGEMLKDTAILSFTAEIYALCLKNNINPPPEIYVAHSHQDAQGKKGDLGLNAKAGRIGNKNILVFYEDLLNTFTGDEEMGVAAHEIGHLFLKHWRITKEMEARLERENGKMTSKQEIELVRKYAAEERKGQIQADSFAIKNGYGKQLYAALTKTFQQEKEYVEEFAQLTKEELLLIKDPIPQTRLLMVNYKTARQEKNKERD